jgi:hypothetical protein
MPQAVAQARVARTFVVPRARARDGSQAWPTTPSGASRGSGVPRWPLCAGRRSRRACWTAVSLAPAPTPSRPTSPSNPTARPACASRSTAPSAPTTARTESSTRRHPSRLQPWASRHRRPLVLGATVGGALGAVSTAAKAVSRGRLPQTSSVKASLRRSAHSSRKAWTNAWGRLPRSAGRGTWVDLADPGGLGAQWEEAGRFSRRGEPLPCRGAHDLCFRGRRHAGRYPTERTRSVTRVVADRERPTKEWPARDVGTRAGRWGADLRCGCGTPSPWSSTRGSPRRRR